MGIVFVTVQPSYQNHLKQYQVVWGRLFGGPQVDHFKLFFRLVNLVLSLFYIQYIYWFKCVSDVIYEYTKSKLIYEFLPHLQWTNYRIGAFLLLLHAEYLYLLIPTCLPTTWESNQPAWCHHTEPNSHLHHWPVPSCTPTCVNGACVWSPHCPKNHLNLTLSQL